MLREIVNQVIADLDCKAYSMFGKEVDESADTVYYVELVNFQTSNIIDCDTCVWVTYNADVNVCVRVAKELGINTSYKLFEEHIQPLGEKDRYSFQKMMVEEVGDYFVLKSKFDVAGTHRVEKE